jgi:hypothetical protein
VNSFVIAIALVSTFMHAGWILLARKVRSESEFYKKMLIITLLVGFLPAVVSETRTGSMTPLAWACVIASVISAVFYLFGLVKAPVRQFLPSSTRLHELYRGYSSHLSVSPRGGT